jgi:hypothetical protein
VLSKILKQLPQWEIVAVFCLGCGAPTRSLPPPTNHPKSFPPQVASSRSAAAFDPVGVWKGKNAKARLTYQFHFEPGYVVRWCWENERYQQVCSYGTWQIGRTGSVLIVRSYLGTDLTLREVFHVNKGSYGAIQLRLTNPADVVIEIRRTTTDKVDPYLHRKGVVSRELPRPPKNPDADKDLADAG